MDTKENIDTESEVTTEEKQTGTDQAKTEKVFTQSELDSLIQNRLKREKDGFTKIQKEWETEKISLSDQIERYEKTISNLLADRKAKLTDTEKKLIEKLSIEDQLEFLLGSEQEEKKEVKKIPELPKAKENEKKGFDQKLRKI